MTDMEALFMEVTDLRQVESLIDTWEGEELLNISEELLRTFIAANFVGCVDEASSSCAIGQCPSVVVEEAVLKDLSFDFNRPFRFARRKHYVWLAKLMLIDRGERIKNCFRKCLSICRCAHLWQLMLSEPAAELKVIADEQEENLLSLDISGISATEFFLERMYAHMFYFEYDAAEECLNKALKSARLGVELTGVLGKRTRFQQNDIPQLIANAFLVSEDPEETSEGCSEDVPVDVRMNDDTLLEKILLANGEDTVAEGKLSPSRLACILGICAFELGTQHRDELLIERCSAYIDKVIAQRSNWAIQASALVQRCQLEKHRRRRIERACSQSELIVKLMDGIDDEVPPFAKMLRTSFAVASGLPPFWRVQSIHADILRALGCTSEALRIFEQLEMWDLVIDCYKSLDQLEKAEFLVRDLIAKNPSDPVNYCLLGDITLQQQYYDKAIEISNGRCARAYRSLGNLFLIRNHFDVAFDNFKRSLELQPIQLGVWFNLGHCGWKLERYQDAASAYHRCVQLEPEHFEAWNNLAAAYIRLKQKSRAQKILQEALKFNYDHAKMWENYLLLSVDTGDFGSAIQAFHRLLDLKNKHEDDEVIEILTTEILKLRDVDDSRYDDLLDNMCKLLGRISSVQTCSGKMWRCYAMLKKPRCELASTEEYEKYVKLLERAYLADHNKQNWEEDESSCCAVLKAAIELSNAKMKFSQVAGSDIEILMKSQIRMALRPLIVLTERSHGKEAENTQNEELIKALSTAKEILSIVSS